MTTTTLEHLPLTAAQLSAVLGVCRWTVYRWQGRDGMPRNAVGRTSYAQCMAWLAAHPQVLHGKGRGALTLARVRRLVEEWNTQEAT